MSEVPSHFADRLFEAIAEKGSPVCVGLDPVYAKLPAELRSPAATLEDEVTAIGAFCEQVIGLVAPYVPAVKPQIACFERYGSPGLALYYQVVALAQDMGLIVIGDVKRGDIGSTAEAYADAHLGTLASENEIWTWAPDAVTVNGYFGVDGTEPFVRSCRNNGAGLFVLVRTSNPGGAAIQDFQGADGKKFFVHMAEQVAALGDGEGLVGQSGYSCVGAVVGATYPQEARLLRQVMPRQIFLVPGYGAQGATAADCAAAFDADGRGAIVNASRSVLYAFAGGPNRSWTKAVKQAAQRFAADIVAALGG
ncbi:MAG: orotidine-5'-phosphate decarboxylase [Planctomycetes bacterium]|nr:orotidine-5'-phosphate decarboxylase [Planctomycetota bacterium]